MVKFGKRVKEAKERETADFKNAYVHYAELKKLLRVISDALRSSDSLADDKLVKRKLAASGFFEDLERSLAGIAAKDLLRNRKFHDKNSRILRGKVPRKRAGLLKEYFVLKIKEEIERLNRFSRAKERELNQARAQLKHVEADGGKLSHGDENSKRICTDANADDARRRILTESNRLERFLEFQRTAFFKILKKFDKITGENIKDTMMRDHVQCAPFCNSNAMRVDARERALRKGVRDMKRAARRGAVAVASALCADRSDPEGKEAQRYLRKTLKHAIAETCYDNLPSSSASARSSDSGTTGPEPAAIRRAKRTLFRNIISQVSREIEKCDPDASLAVENLRITFEELYGSYDSHSGLDGSSGVGSSISSADDDERVGNRKRVRSSNVLPCSVRRKGEDDEDASSERTSLSAAVSFGSGGKDVPNWHVCCNRIARRFRSGHWLGRYDWNASFSDGSFLSDLVAAVVISVMVVPQGLAYAQLAGLDPVYGIYAAVFPPIVYALAGGQGRVVAVGPQSVPCLLMGAIVDARVGADAPMDERLGIVLSLTMMVGVAMCVVGVLRLGFLIHFVSKPVFTGFVSACGVVTALSVSKDLLGVSIEKSAYVYDLVPDLARALPSSSWPTVVTSICAMSTLLYLKHLLRKKDDGEEEVEEEVEEAEKKQLTAASEASSSSSSSSSSSMTCSGRCVRRALPPILLFVSLGILTGGFLCGWDTSGDGVGPNILPAVGAGASLPNALYKSTMSTFLCTSESSSFSEEMNVTYESTGSGDGQAAIVANEVDFAGTDVPWISTSILPEDLIMYPTVATAVCAVANIPTMQDGVQLRSLDVVVSREVLAEIFRGSITFWDDERILAHNLNVRSLVPHEPIRVVVRSDRSGTTAIFTRALSRFDNGTFARTVGEGVAPAWNAAFSDETLAFANSSSGVVDAVLSIPYAISYLSVDLVRARSDDLRCLALASSDTCDRSARSDDANASVTVTPSVDAVVRAIEIAHAFNLAENSTLSPFDSIDLMSAEVLRDGLAWPISSFTYVAVRLNTTRSDCARRAWIAAYLGWLYISADAQTYAAASGFVSMPESIRRQMYAHIEANVRCASTGNRVLSDVLSGDVRELADISWLDEGRCSDIEDVALDDDDVYCESVKMIGDVDFELMYPTLPSFARFDELALDAIFVTMAVLLEHVSNLKLYAEIGEYDVNTDVDFVSIGISNVVGSLFGAFAVGGGFSRSAVNKDAGARSQMSLLASGFVVVALALTVRPMLYLIPKPVLATLIFVAVVKLVDVRGAQRIWRVSKWDATTMGVAFVATLCVGISGGILLAVASSMALFIYYAASPRVVELGRIVGTVAYRACDSGELSKDSKNDDDDDERSSMTARSVLSPPNAFVLRPDAPLFFGNVEMLLKRIDAEVEKRFSLARLRKEWTTIVLAFGCVGWIDSTAAEAIRKHVELLRRRWSVPVCLAECNDRVLKRLRRSGVVTAIGGEAFCFVSVHSAVRSCARELRNASAHLPRIVLKSRSENDFTSSYSSASKTTATDRPGAIAASKAHPSESVVIELGEMKPSRDE